MTTLKEENIATNFPGDGLVSEKMVGRYIDTRLELVRKEIQLSFNIFFLGITSLIMMISIISNWNKHRDLKIKAKLLRVLIHEST